MLKMAHSEHREFLKLALLDTVVKSKAHFKHQQRGEPDLTYEQKLKIAIDCLEKKPDIFLSKYGKFLEEAHLEYFATWKGDYVFDYYLSEIRRTLNDKKNRTKIKNRRYEAMKQLVDKGEYFGDEEMKQRDPLLYEQMVGQFLSAEEIQSQVDKCEASFANILMKHVQVQQNNELYTIQKQIEDQQTQQLDSEDLATSTKKAKDDDDSDESEIDSENEDKPKISDDEKVRLREEFLSIMQQRFLNGKDDDFDYEEVDGNVVYDSIDIRTQDEEEKYFDDEDPSDYNQTEQMDVSTCGAVPAM